MLAGSLFSWRVSFDGILDMTKSIKMRIYIHDRW